MLIAYRIVLGQQGSPPVPCEASLPRSRSRSHALTTAGRQFPSLAARAVPRRWPGMGHRYSRYSSGFVAAI